MTEKEPIQNQMYSDFENKHLFDTANTYAKSYIDTIMNRNVFPTEEALENLTHFDEDMPNESTDAKAVLKQLNTYGSPATVASLGGRYFGFVCGSAVPVGLAAKALATFWDQSPTMHILSPIGSKLESVVENWLKKLFNLPEETVAGFVSGNQDWNINENGFFNAPKIRVITGKHAHSTVLKAISLLGFGKNTIEWVDVDEHGSIRADEIPELDHTTVVILQAGNVNSGSFDDFEAICTKAQKAGAWVHIDGAFGLWAGAVQQLQYLTKGIEKANSWAVDGHKTLNTPYDSGIILCKDKEAMASALHMSGSYIVTSEKRDGMFYTPEMSRRARVIELWAILKYLGKSGVDEMIYNMHARAVQFAESLKNIDGFSVLNDIVFNQVLVQCKTDEITIKTMEKIQELRDCWVGGSLWKGKKVIRISVCSWATTETDVRIAITSFKKALLAITNETAA